MYVPVAEPLTVDTCMDTNLSRVKLGAGWKQRVYDDSSESVNPALELTNTSKTINYSKTARQH